MDRQFEAAFVENVRNYSYLLLLGESVWMMYDSNNTPSSFQNRIGQDQKSQIKFLFDTFEESAWFYRNSKFLFAKECNGAVTFCPGFVIPERTIQLSNGTSVATTFQIVVFSIRVTRKESLVLMERAFQRQAALFLKLWHQTGNKVPELSVKLYGTTA